MSVRQSWPAWYPSGGVRGSDVVSGPPSQPLRIIRKQYLCARTQVGVLTYRRVRIYYIYGLSPWSSGAGCLPDGVGPASSPAPAKQSPQCSRLRSACLVQGAVARSPQKKACFPAMGEGVPHPYRRSGYASARCYGVYRVRIFLIFSW